MSVTHTPDWGRCSAEAILPDSPSQPLGRGPVPSWLGFRRSSANQVFPTKRRCALGLSVGTMLPFSPAALARTAKPELDPRDDA